MRRVPTLALVSATIAFSAAAMLPAHAADAKVAHITARDHGTFVTSPLSPPLVLTQDQGTGIATHLGHYSLQGSRSSTWPPCRSAMVPSPSPQPTATASSGPTPAPPQAPAIRSSSPTTSPARSPVGPDASREPKGNSPGTASPTWEPGSSPT